MKFVIVSAAILALLSAGAPAQQPAQPVSALHQMNDSFAGVFEKVSPAVVVIESRQNTPSPIPGLPDGLQFFLQGPNGSQAQQVPNVGSGFLFRPDGHILTNFHVVDNSDEIMVKLHDGRKFKAKVVGADQRSDVAVLKIEGDHFPVAELGNSDAVRVGEFAFAIGTPMDLPYTFTVGVVSAKGRNLQIGGGYEFIQTDASINPGNSGGPLCDIEGRVVGINALISGTNRGLGFSIPINTAKNIADQLLTKGHVVRPWLGITIKGIQEDPYLQGFFPALSKGVVVREINEGTPAESSELRAGDVILKVDGTEVGIASDLQHEILSKKIGQKVVLEVWRSGGPVRVEILTAEQPDPLMHASNRPRRQSAPQNIPSSAPVQPSTPGFTYQNADKEILKEFGIKRQASGGVVVTNVEAGSAAAVAGLEKGDLITEAGGHPVLNQKDLEAVLHVTSPDRGILLLLERGEQRTFAILKP